MYVATLFKTFVAETRWFGHRKQQRFHFATLLILQFASFYFGSYFPLNIIAIAAPLHEYR